MTVPPLSLDKPFTFTQPLDMTEARAALRAVANSRREAREWFQRASQNAAEKERTYRKQRAVAWATVDGTAKEKEDAVNDKTADLRFERDVAVSLVKATLERLEEVDAERASLHRLVEWSMKVAPLGAPAEPAEFTTYGGVRA